MSAEMARETPGFGDEARRVLARARAAARWLRHDHLGPEHLLLGLLDERRGLASAVLHQANIEEAKLRAAVASLAPPGAAAPEAEFIMAPALRRILRLATTETQRLRNDAVQSEHLLLAIVREGTAGVAGVLTALGLDLETLRLAVAREHHARTDARLAAGWVARGPLRALAWLGVVALVAAGSVLIWTLAAVLAHRPVSLPYSGVLALALVAVGLVGVGSSRMEVQRAAATLEWRVDEWRRRRAPAQVAQALRLAGEGNEQEASTELLRAVARPMPETEYRESLLALAPWLAREPLRPLALRARAELHLHAERLDLALSDVSAAVRAAPTRAEWQHLLGVALARTGRLAEAAVHLRQACQLDAGHAEWWSDLAGMSLRLGELDEAARACARAGELAPAEARPLALGSALRLLHGELDHARAALDRARELDPDDPLVSVVRTALLLRLGAPEQALALARRCASASLEPPAWLLALEGWALVALGRADEAQLVFARARGRDPELLPTCERLATALEALGETAAAAAQRELAVALAGG